MDALHREAFASMIAPLVPEMTRFARRLYNGHEHDADDLVQDAMEWALGAFDSWQPTGEPTSAARAWLYRTINEMFCQRRGRPVMHSDAS